jgi:DNA-binding NarL/FixJ family response regulator
MAQQSVTATVVRTLPRRDSRRRTKARRRVFLLFEHPLFENLVSNLLNSSNGVEIVGRSNDLYDAAPLIRESRAEAVVVEGNPANCRDLSLLNYLLVASVDAPWVELVMLSAQSNDFVTVYRGNMKHLDTKRLLSLILAG